MSQVHAFFKGTKSKSKLYLQGVVTATDTPFILLSELNYNTKSLSFDEKRIIDTFRIQSTVKNRPDLGRSAQSLFKTPRSLCISPNDSFLYVSFINKKYQWTKNVGGTGIDAYVLDGISTTTIRQYSVYENKRNVVFRDVDFYIGRKYFDSHRCLQFLRLMPDGKIYFANNDYDGDYFIGYINRPNEELVRENIFEKAINVTNGKKPKEYCFGLPHSLNDYKKLRFLRAKQCTNELKLFADADSFFQKFEWYVANDTGGFDVFTGKNLRYPSKGKRTFYVKVKGIAKTGYYAWYSDTITFNTQPKAAFTVDTSQWCQWVGLQLQNTSVSEGAKSNSFTWQLLQNDTIKKTYSGKNPYLTFNANGSFDIRLIYNDGICVDTFTRKAAINIIPAAKPVFQVRDSAVCKRDSVVVIDKAVGQVSKREYQWSDGFISNQRRHARFFDSVGQYKIIQTLTGPTGCITKDSQWVRIRPGFTKNDSTEMLTASVLDSHLVLLKWKTNPNNMIYGIYRQQKGQNFWPIDVWGHSQDSIIDTVPNTTRTTQYQYFVRMGDSCFNMSKESNHASTMVLSRKNYNNQYVVLTWNAYEKWYGGVKEYVIESSENKRDWLPIDASGQLSYPDYRLPQLQSDTVYYRIKAIEQNGNQQHSYSNVVKVPINTTLFIPNAFRPNGDGVNDIFKIGHFGLQEFECKIYSSTGQIVSYSTNPDEIWDGEFNELPYPMGNYRYVIKAIDQKGKELYYEGTLVLIR